MLRIYKYIAVLVLLLVGVAVGFLFALCGKEDKVEIREGQVKDVNSLVQLCTIDIYNEVPILDTINGRVMFAVQKQRGTISFDVEKLQIDNSGDTLKVTLPAEIIELYESTDPDSWHVVDTKSVGALSLFRSNTIPEKDENILKGKIRNRSICRLYENGVVEKARAEASVTLRGFLEKIYRKPVEIMDPIPKGSLHH